MVTGLHSTGYMVTQITRLHSTGYMVTQHMLQGYLHVTELHPGYKVTHATWLQTCYRTMHSLHGYTQCMLQAYTQVVWLQIGYIQVTGLQGYTQVTELQAS